MSSEPANSHRQQQLYWNQMTELRIASAYIRQYRDDSGKWVKRIGTLKAIAASSSIAGWLVWKDYAAVWALIIAASQLAEALKDVFPVARIHKAAGEHATVLSSMFIDAQLEWESIFAGRYSDDQISKQRHKLMKLQHDAEKRNFPDGLPFRKPLFEAAQAEAKQYFKAIYGVE